ncbi:tyrosine-type recombinase/integrase [Streptomyces anulatus]|uniref:tyrosine-type recombinase/integrase n=1 Tax=Streptomyces anulatus TaxID=1892 RepID=UPI0033D3328B
MAGQKHTLLCGSHHRQWTDAGRPERTAWALTARAVYTTVDVVPLNDLPPMVFNQVLVGYQAHLREGVRLSPGQVKSAIVWLVDHAVQDLRTAELPAAGTTTTFLRIWQRALVELEADPETEHTRDQIRMHILNPVYRGKGSVDLRDVHAPWLRHLTQQHVRQLAASGASHTGLALAGYSARWFAMFLRTLPGEGRQPGPAGRAGMTAYLRWLTARAQDTSDYQALSGDDPVREVIAERLLPGLGGTGPLLVTPLRHHQLVKSLRDVLEQGRSWLAEAGAADVHLLGRDIPPRSDRDDTDSELEGRSQDALPEAVFFQLMDPAQLDLLPPGSRRNYIELALRVGRRPWEVRHLEFDCIQWHEVDTEDPDGNVQRQSYPFLAYWMQKVRRRHLLPLHATDVEVISRQQEHLRAEFPQWFDADGRPLSARMLLFPTTRLTRANRRGERPYVEATAGYWIGTWLEQTRLVDEHGNDFDAARVFMYAFRHTYAQIRADAGVPLDVLQALMSHQDPSTTQVYYRVSHPRRVDAVRAIAAKYRFDLSGGRVRPLAPEADIAERIRAGVGSVPVPAGQCQEMNNVRADGHGCPVYYRCFSCKFFTTDFTQLPELRQVRDAKAEQLLRLEAAYGSVLAPGPLSRANVELLRQELIQLDELIGKCETDLGSLTEDDKATVESWLHSRDRFLTVIPVAAVLAGRQHLDRPTTDPILLTEETG